MPPDALPIFQATSPRVIPCTLAHVATALAELNRARCPHRFTTVWLATALLGLLSSLHPGFGCAQSPELAMRDLSSGQIKKGVRSIGFGGDGATWGNYSLVWKDAGTALVDYGDTSYTNDNDFHFVALGATTPSLWHGLAIYVIAMTSTPTAFSSISRRPASVMHPCRWSETAPTTRCLRRLRCPSGTGSRQEFCCLTRHLISTRRRWPHLLKGFNTVPRGDHPEGSEFLGSPARPCYSVSVSC